jgi:hypothetical protein
VCVEVQLQSDHELEDEIGGHVAERVAGLLCDCELLGHRFLFPVVPASGRAILSRSREALPPVSHCQEAELTCANEHTSVFQGWNRSKKITINGNGNKEQWENWPRAPRRGVDAMKLFCSTSATGSEA